MLSRVTTISWPYLGSEVNSEFLEGLGIAIILESKQEGIFLTSVYIASTLYSLR